MGWNCVYQKEKKSLQDITNFIQSEYAQYNPKHIEFAPEGVYFAMTNPNTQFVFGMFVKITQEDYEFCWKEIPEKHGPVYTNASAALINSLSPTKNENALQWRNACLFNSK